jgi:signal transduction histidine kinase/CheY-like chemotaxis protein
LNVFLLFISGPTAAVAGLALALAVALVLVLRRSRRSGRDRDWWQEKAVAQENKLKQAQRMEAVGIHAGSIVHNLNNLLAVILGHARMARRDNISDTSGNEDLDQIIKASTVASELVQEISDFYRQADQARKPTDLAPLVRDTLKFLRDIMPANVQIQEDLDPRCGLVLATATGVQQVLMNLCSNSLHAMYREHGVIEVTLRQETVTERQRAIPGDLEPGSYVKLSVRDNGRGLSRESLGRIFDSYFSESQAEGGMGIGLSTVYRILKDHEGVSIPQGRVGHGACFDIYFPLIAWSVVSPVAVTESAQPLTVLEGQDSSGVPAAAAPLDPVASVVASDEVPPGERGHVLLVDDEEMVSRVTSLGLNRLGFEVTSHNDARQALANFIESPDHFDAVVTDQIMPHMSGVRLTKKIHGIRPHIPVILMTGFRDSFNEQQATEAGVRDFILKPFSHRDLAKLLDRTLLRRMEGSN